MYVVGLEQSRLWCLVLLDSLRALNIDVNIRPTTWPEMVAMCQSPETYTGFFCLYFGISYPDPDVVVCSGYHSSRNGTWQNAVYNNPEVDRLIEAGRFEPYIARRA